jgi:hypothetical protein
MTDNDDLEPRAKKKGKKKRREESNRGLPIALLIGAGVVGLFLVGALIWGLVSLFSGAFAPVVAQARPADKVPQGPGAAAPAAPAAVSLETLPSASPGWKVTPDGVALASGLPSAVTLPDGEVNLVLFSDPAQAQAAVLMTGEMLPPPPGTVVHTNPAYPVRWVPVDLKGGQAGATVPLGDVYPGTRVRLGAKVTTAALSPSGERLAAVFLGNGATTSQVWDRTGKKLLDVPKEAGTSWLAFQSEGRLLAYGSGKLTALDVPSGAVAYTVNDVNGLVALSPGRKWVCAVGPAGGLRFFSTTDGTLAGEITKVGKVSGLAFSPDGASIAVKTDSVAVWDVATGKPTQTSAFLAPKVNDDRPPRLAWLGGKHLLLGGVLLDLERKQTLCEYDCRPYTLSQATSPDGRLWSAGSFKDVMITGNSQHQVTHGPIYEAGVKGTPLLAAFTAPDADMARRVEDSFNGIPFLPDEPARIEVVGYGSTKAKQKLADAAAEELAKRGKAVDPEAKVGVRIEVGAMQRVKVARGSSPPGVIIAPRPGDVSDAYQVEASVRLINRANGAVSKTPHGLTRRVPADAENREEILLAGIGKHIGWQMIPLVGYYTSTGEEAKVKVGEPILAHIGIDGVIDLNRRK